MPVTPRGQSFQATVYWKGDRYRRQFPTEIEAKRWELDSLEALKEGRTPDLGLASSASQAFRCTTVGQLMGYLIEHRWTGTKGEKSSIINAKHAARLFGEDTLLTAITGHSVNLAVAELRREGYPDSTINKKLSAARVAFEYAATEGWMPKAPAIPFFKPGEGRLKVFTADEEAAQIAWCEQANDIELLDYIITSYDIGWRQSEALTAKPRNLTDKPGWVTLWGKATDLDNGTKAGNTRRVPLTPRARAILERRAAATNNLLFSMTQDELQKKWARMRLDLGFTDDEEWVPHAMRHTFCSRLVNQHNVNVAVVQRLAGHLRIETTLKYVHVDQEAMVRAIEALGPPRASVENDRVRAA